MKLWEGPSELLDVLLCLLCPASLGTDHTLGNPAASGCVVAKADTRAAPTVQVIVLGACRSCSSRRQMRKQKVAGFLSCSSGSAVMTSAAMQGL